MRRAAVIACLIATPGGFAACGGPDTDGARKAAQDYVSSLGKRDGRATCAQMTTALQRQFTQAVVRANSQFRGRTCPQIMQVALASIPQSQLQQFSQAKIENLKVDGDKGTFRYQLGQIQVDGQVAKEDGDWKVSCCVPGAGG